MKKRSYFKCPNALICDDRLSYTARRVGCVLFAFTNAFGVCRKGYVEIARIANVSTATVVSAVNALEELGYLTVAPTKRYCAEIGGVGYGRNEYTLNLSVLKKGYTRASRDVFGYELTASAFIVYLAILMFQGGKNRAWPSIAKLQKATGAACSTICAGLKLLRKLPTILVQRFVKPDGAFAANSYQPAAAFVGASCTENAGEVRENDRLLSRLYSITDILFSQGVQLFFGHVGVLRNLVIKVMTYLTLAFTRRERSNLNEVENCIKRITVPVGRTNLGGDKA